MNRAERLSRVTRITVVGAMLLLTIGLMLCALDDHHHMPGHPMPPELCNGAWLSPDVVVLIIPIGTAMLFTELKQSFSAATIQRLDPPPKPRAFLA
jgi:hypothetical protein